MVSLYTELMSVLQSCLISSIEMTHIYHHAWHSVSSPVAIGMSGLLYDEVFPIQQKMTSNLEFKAVVRIVCSYNSGSS